MNKQRREAINKIGKALEDLRDQLDELMQEEQEYFDNIPESLQGGDKGDIAQAAIEGLQQAYYDIDNVVSSLEDLWTQ